MSRMQRWLLIGLAVALAAFLSGVIRGMTDTAPFDVAPPTTSTSPEP